MTHLLEFVMVFKHDSAVIFIRENINFWYFLLFSSPFSYLGGALCAGFLRMIKLLTTHGFTKSQSEIPKFSSILWPIRMSLDGFRKQANKTRSDWLKYSWKFVIHDSWNRVLSISYQVREHSYMTSDVFWAFLTYLPTLIRYFTT